MSAVDINDGDDDSLFGSPPSSPNLSPSHAPEPVQSSPVTTPVLAPALEVRGRSSSLALPCSSQIASSSGGGVGIILPNQNVGTIALPGSQVGAETIVVLPASPPRNKLSAQASSSSSSGEVLQDGYSRPRLAQVKTNTSIGVSAFNKGRQPSQRKQKERAAKQVVESPVFTLPSDSEPLPANFLRNQQALLGLAGVIAGLNPARLSTCTAKGATAQNPIVIDDTSSAHSRPPKANRNQLPMPTGSEIASILMKQQEILPLLKSLLPYLAGKDSAETFSSERDVHVAKKRRTDKLRDWWERDREKKLLMQLVGIVKDAIQKAVNRYSTSGASAATVTPEAYASSIVDRTDSYCQSDIPKEVPLTSNNLHPSAPVDTPYSQTDFPAIFDEPWNDFSLSNLEGDLKTWLDSLDGSSFDTPEFSRPQTSASSFSTGSNSPTLSTYSRLSTPVDAIHQVGLDKENGMKENSIISTPGTMTADVDVRVADDLDFSSFNFDIPIDPVLFEFCGLPPQQASSPSVSSVTPTSSESIATPDAPGTSSDALTPSDSLPKEVQDVQAPIPSPPPPRAPIIVPPPPPRPVTVIAPSPFLHPSMRAATANRQPSSGRTGAVLASASLCEEQAMPFINLFPPPPSTSKATTASLLHELTTTAATSSRQTTSNPKSTKTALDRQAILRRARERREQLVAEIARAKIELWETTIEQGVLVHLSKDSTLIE